MISESQQSEELEELDIAEALQKIERRLTGLDLALAGAGLSVETFDALTDLVLDARSDLHELVQRLKAQDEAKRAQGAARAARVFLDAERGGPIVEGVES
ncbi:hypothetical protein LG047_07135 [Methylocystis sp. WRRC1]|uniref:hypothetical protein n=1 Tax=Methylocystis sp. WRRC1 TaxID=1732014 RepID=UPI001D145D51|nr:hypothetical protein [Methylocystis sp. WRRC1]MCC3245091.1 hypothetical protein [Methylocystis sp. WRRC1]